MNSKPINNAIKNHFYSVFNNAKNRANESYAVLKSQLSNQDHFNQLKLIVDEDKRIDSLMDASEYPFYQKNNTDEWLLTQFANRTYLLSVDESAELEEAIYLTKYHELLYDELEKLENGIPKYTYQMFLKGEACKYYSTFDKNYTTDEKNFNAIKDWQAYYMQEIITYDYLILIALIQNYARTIDKPLEYIALEKDRTSYLLDKVDTNYDLIIKAMNQLHFLSEFDKGRFDHELLADNLSVYRASQLNLKEISPKTIAAPISQIKQKHKTLISTEATLFYTIDKVLDWMEKVVDGLPLNQPVKEPKWNSLVTGTIYKATKEIKALTKEIERTAYDTKLTKQEIKTFLVENFEVYRHRFNNFKRKDYFYALKEGNEKLLKRMVITNSFFGNDTKGQMENLYDTIVIQEMSWTIVQIFAEIFETHKIQFPDEDKSHFAIMSLLNSMVLDRELYNALNQSLDDFMQRYEHYRLPMDIHFQNQKENMHHIFHRGINRLQDVLDDAEPNNKILYLQSRLKQLKQRELQLKEFSEERDFGTYDDRYSGFLMDFLNLEAEFINQTKDVIAIPPLKLAGKALFRPDGDDFDALLTKEKGIFVLEVLEKLSLTKDGRSIISLRKKGALRGVVEALKEYNILPAKSLDILCKAIADKIGLDLKSKLDDSYISQDYKSKALSHLKVNLNISQQVL